MNKTTLSMVLGILLATACALALAACTPASQRDAGAQKAQANWSTANPSSAGGGGDGGGGGY